MHSRDGSAFHLERLRILEWKCLRFIGDNRGRRSDSYHYINNASLYADTDMRRIDLNCVEGGLGT